MTYKESIKHQAPNILTVFRVLLVPFFIYALFGMSIQSAIASLLIFIIASISDYFDGYLARKFNARSRLGVFLDPLADKILTGGAFISFVILPDFNVPLWLVLVILLREVTVTILRLISIKRNRPVRTEYSGKIKTAFQMFSIISILLLLCIKRIFLSIRPGLDSGGEAEFWIRLAGPVSGPICYFIPLVLISISAVLAFASMGRLSPTRSKYLSCSTCNSLA